MKPNSSSRNGATEKILRRREWKLEQERQRQHERLKQKMIYEYEMQRAREKGLLAPKAPNRSRSQSRSKSPRSRPRRPCTSSSTNTPILSERLESVDGTIPLCRGPKGTKITAAELCRIKVDIHQNIPGKSTDSDLQRNIINAEDVVVKRRAGEGSKPIFEREEIKGIVTNIEVEEHRTVITVNNDTLGKSKTFKKRSMFLSPIRNRSHSPRRTLSRRTRDERYYRKYGERIRERSRDRRDRDRSREQRVSLQHNFGQIPVRIYYTHFPPSPIMMTPLMSIRGHSLVMRLLETFRKRFVPPYIHRLPFNPSHYRSKNF